MKHLKKKRPILVVKECFFHWDNALVPTAAKVQDWLTTHNVDVMAPIDVFLFWHVKDELTGNSLDQNTLKTR